MITSEQIAKNQSWQESFLYQQSDKLLEYAWRHDGYEYLPYISLSCKPCHASCELHTFEGSIQWLHRHWGHNTWLDYMGNTK